MERDRHLGAFAPLMTPACPVTRADLTLTNRFSKYFGRLLGCVCCSKMTEGAGGGNGDDTRMLYARRLSGRGAMRRVCRQREPRP